jgi:hypothetical protein
VNAAGRGLLLELRHDVAQLVHGLMVLLQVFGQEFCQPLHIPLIVRLFLIHLQCVFSLGIALCALLEEAPGTSHELGHAVGGVFAYLRQCALGDKWGEGRQCLSCQFECFHCSLPFCCLLNVDNSKIPKTRFAPFFIADNPITNNR